jgi:hypothetical protein
MIEKMPQSIFIAQALTFFVELRAYNYSQVKNLISQSKYSWQAYSLIWIQQIFIKPISAHIYLLIY